ncbi:MAG TPA: AAA family ATPase [Bryobacteraceae bacterium]
MPVSPMSVSNATAELDLLQPYPGLRPFQPEEALKFHGRETHTAELLRRLAESRFVAVVGNSGSGKSSLVRAGLLPALYRGRLIGATSQWRICIMRPEEAPVRALARALAEQNVPSTNEGAVFEEVNRSTLGLVRAVRAAKFAPGESLLLVVDQFEELFRFARERKEEDGGADARLFVDSLREAADLSSAPVYIVLTMRSEFLGDCSQFPGLPELLNRGQYLIPAMTRDQIRAAIEKPVRLAGAKMSARLVELLLNQLGSDTGQLPVLQHALNQTFQQWKKNGTSGEIGVDDYALAGEMKGSLNAHAESLLDPKLDPWTEWIFRCLTTVEPGGRKIRRPTRLDRMFEIVGAFDERARGRVLDVIRIYGHRDHAMLVWSRPALSDESVVDISHESLIEHWERLGKWVDAEADAASLYQAASLDVKAKRRGAAARWRGQRLLDARQFIEKGPWNQAWAARLRIPDALFADVGEFVEQEAVAELTAAQRAKEDAEARAAAEAKAKQAAQSQAKAERRMKWAIAAAAALGVGLALFGLFYQVGQKKQAKQQKDALAALRQLAASDDIVTQSTRQIDELKKQLAEVRDAAERQRAE